jgi:hypothetical protein
MLLTTSIALSAFLIFLVQPLFARQVLPLLGGSASVWTAAMLFFQIGLVGGYLYAHLIQKIRSVRVQGGIHLFLTIVVGCIGYPALSLAKASSSSSDPLWWLFSTATISLGLPFLLLASNSSLLQSWHGAVLQKDEYSQPSNPYRLYVISNCASFLGLFSYPFFLEPRLLQSDITQWWNYGFLIFLSLTLIISLKVMQKGGPATSLSEDEDATVAAPTIFQYLTWLSIAFLPNALVLSITTRTSTDIAPFPLLWILPLALYLLSFLWGFSERPWKRGHIYTLCMIVLTTYTICLNPKDAIAQFTIEYGTLWVVAVSCHRALYTRRPSPRYLSGFYLTLAAGGVGAGLWCALGAPFLFDQAVIEYPLALLCATVVSLYERSDEPLSPRTKGIISVSAMTLAVVLLWYAEIGWVPSYFNQSQMILIGGFLIGATIILLARPLILLCLIASLASLGLYRTSYLFSPLYAERNFYGRLAVLDVNPSLRTLLHGSTIHGGQLKIPGKELTPLYYYTDLGPLSNVFDSLPESYKALPLGVVGLGTGVVSVYGKHFSSTDFYEIDRDVESIARTYFTYLERAASPVRVIIGDGRLELQKAPPQKYAMILLDAFSSDAIPTHLLTLEAFQTYKEKIKENGELVVHLSNRYLSLAPVVAKIAEKLDMTAVHMTYKAPSNLPPSITSSEWMVLLKDKERIEYYKSKGWIPRRITVFPVWSDNFTSILPIIKWEHE